MVKYICVHAYLERILHMKGSQKTAEIPTAPIAGRSSFRPAWLERLDRLDKFMILVCSVWLMALVVFVTNDWSKVYRTGSWWPSVVAFAVAFAVTTALMALHQHEVGSGVYFIVFFFILMTLLVYAWNIVVIERWGWTPSMCMGGAMIVFSAYALRQRWLDSP